jgi:hypothetical protein
MFGENSELSVGAISWKKLRAHNCGNFLVDSKKLLRLAIFISF